MKSRRLKLMIHTPGGWRRPADRAQPSLPSAERGLLFLQLFEVGAKLASPQLQLPPTGAVEEAGTSGGAGSRVAEKPAAE